MAIVLNTGTDTISITTTYAIAPGVVQPKTFIPRGVGVHNGQRAIATLAAGNQTGFTLTLNFSSSYIYLLKQMSMRYRADTVEETSFNNVGSFDLIDGASLLSPISTEVFSRGNHGTGATLESTKTWQQSPGAPRTFIDGTQGDTVLARLTDPDAAAGGKVAGDMFWDFEWFFFDPDQMLEWPVHTATPVLCY